MPSAYGSMVKWTSSIASNEVFRVRVLVELLTEELKTEGLPDWRREPVGSRSSNSIALRVRLRREPVRPTWKPVYSEHASRMESWSKFISEAYWNAELRS